MVVEPVVRSERLRYYHGAPSDLIASKHFRGGEPAAVLNASPEGQPIMVKGACFSQTSGDEAGSLGGMVSSKTKGMTEFINFSFDVKAEGKNVARLGDPMVGNKGTAANTPPIPEVQPPDVGITQRAGDNSPTQSLTKVEWEP